MGLPLGLGNLRSGDGGLAKAMAEAAAERADILAQIAAQREIEEQYSAQTYAIVKRSMPRDWFGKYVDISQVQEDPVERPIEFED